MESHPCVVRMRDPKMLEELFKVPCKRTQPCSGGMLLRIVGLVTQSFKTVKLLSQQLSTFLLFRDHRSVAQQRWIRLHRSSNIVGAAHAHYTWFTKSYGLYPSHDALQVPTLLGVVASVLHTTVNKDPTTPTDTVVLSMLRGRRLSRMLNVFETN